MGTYSEKDIQDGALDLLPILLRNVAQFSLLLYTGLDPRSYGLGCAVRVNTGALGGVALYLGLSSDCVGYDCYGGLCYLLPYSERLTLAL